jgi:hypothetical protein
VAFVMTRRWGSNRSTVLAAGLVALVASFGAVACQPVENTLQDPVAFTPAPLASWRLDGVGRAALLVGDVAYVGGSFTTATAPTGGASAPRANLAAFDARTGALLQTFRADTNGTVRSLATDGTRLFVGGSFTSVGGVARSRLAALDPTTGAVITGWNAPANSNVYALAVGGGRLHVAGSFSTLAGESRSRLGAVDAATGALAGWNPGADATVVAIDASPSGDRVYAGGSFTAVAGSSSRWLAAIDAAGAPVPVPWVGLSGAAIDVELSAGGTRLAVAQAGDGNQVSWFDTAAGTRLWYQRCDGDVQAVAIIGGTVAAGGHEGCEGDLSIRLVAHAAADGARDLSFLPAFDRFWGVHSLDGSSARLVAAGDFTSVGGVAVQGFAIFPTRPVPPPGPVKLSAAASWRYLDGGIAPPASWTGAGFDASGWSGGPAQLGYGDGDEATVVSYGPSATQKHITTWFRTTFNATGVPDTLTLRLLADDGAVVYLNGIEVARDNLPAGTITPTTRASTGRSGADESVQRSFSLPPTAVVVGTNVLAVEVHQDSASSSDLSFAASLSST